jgi:hypothetical protein
MVVGLLGFFTLVAFINAAVAEVRGKPALKPALVLLVFAVLLGLAIRVRQRS